MCGVHAQVMSAAEISLGIRVAGITRSDVRRALWEDRSLVKTIGPRGTVHLRASGCSMARRSIGRSPVARRATSRSWSPTDWSRACGISNDGAAPSPSPSSHCARCDPAERRALEEEVGRLGEIQEASATLTIGTVTAGPHA